jgi:hypothetical protein
MRIRLWSVLVLAGLVIGTILTSWNRVPARDALVPLKEPPTGPQRSGPGATKPVPDHTGSVPGELGAAERTTPEESKPVPPPPQDHATGTVTPWMFRPGVPEPRLVGQKPSMKVMMVTKTSANVPTMMVNSRRICLNFNISDVGPSGISSVELWATRDGHTWQRYSNSPPPPSGPLVVHVAEEGRYGFSLVVKSGVGISSPPPRPGDAPQLWVEVDETRPKVRLLHAEVGKGLESDCLTLTWMASDANLVPKPMTISTSTSKDGPWTPVASNLENTGKYLWHMPRDVPYQFYVRVEASDRAGNHSADCWPEPMKVDRACPHATILGIDPGSKNDIVPTAATTATMPSR